jgi:hypothetical protein
MNHFGSFYGTVLAVLGSIVATVFVIGSVSTAGILG